MESFLGRQEVGAVASGASLDFLDGVVRRILDSWPEGSFLGREAAEDELRTMVAWLRAGGRRDEGPKVLSDRLLARRLGEILLHSVLAHWSDGGRVEDPEACLDALAALRHLPGGALPEEGGAFATRLADPDGFELVVQLAHDLRSPLTSITFLAETLRGEHSGPVSDHQKAQLGLIYGASVGLTTIVSDVVDLARAGGDPLDGEPEAFSIRAVLDSVGGMVQPLAEVKGVEFRTRPTTHDRVVGHPLAISRVLLNLVINGLKFTEHGWVEVAVAPAGGERVEFSVRDTGRGISEENRRKLFQPFRRSPQRDGFFFSSSGLGLSIARRLLLAMGSDLQLETSPDWGTRFYFFLDLPAVLYYRAGEGVVSEQRL